MEEYKNIIITALLTFPLIALFFTMPFMIAQYRKYGAIPLLKIVIVYSFILYLISAYLFVILPLPPIEQVAQSTQPVTQLKPFQFISDFINKSGFKITDPSTYIPALKSSEFIVVIFNIIMFVPYGIYLRYYFKKKWYHTLIYSFLLSLFFELTQLSGLYGIYPRPYRIFDVDDLIQNTFGGMCGFVLAAPLMKILPSRDRLDQIAYERGIRVSLTRRFAAWLIDWFIAFPSYLTIYYLLENNIIIFKNSFLTLFSAYCITVLIFFTLIPLITRGYTIGKAIVKIRLAYPSGAHPKIINYLIRYGILYFIILPAPFYGITLLTLSTPNNALTILNILLFLGTIALWITFIIHFFLTGATKTNKFLYEKLSGIINVSVISNKQENNDSAG